MSEMRTCKECGKLFTPKGREQYCSEIHYRPCPICGAPAEVKYFNDPPRKCDKCSHRRGSSKSTFMTFPHHTKSLFKFTPKDGPAVPKQTIAPKLAEVKPAVNEEWRSKYSKDIPQPTTQSIFCETTSGTVLMYIGNAHKNNFIPGHEYLLKVEHNDYVYEVTSKEDVTAGEDCDIIMPFASQISFHQNFRKVIEEDK